MRWFVAGFLVVLFALPAFGAIWHVRPSGTTYGSGNGTSYENAWSGFASIDCLQISPGDKIIFSGTFYGENDLNWNICADNLTIEGDNATFVHARKVTTWTGQDGNVYYATGFTSYIRMVFEDGIPIKKATDNNCTDGHWFQEDATDRLYYRPTTGVLDDHIVRYERAPFGLFRLNGHGGISFRNLKLTYGEYLIDGNSNYTGNFTSNIIIESCVFEYCALCADFDLSALNEGSVRGGIVFRNNISRFTGPVIHLLGAATKYIEDVTIYNNEFYHSNMILDDCSTNWDIDLYGIGDTQTVWINKLRSSGIKNNKFYGGFAEGIRIYSQDYIHDVNVTSNEFYGIAKPLTIVTPTTDDTATLSNIIVANNYFGQCAPGLYYGHATDINAGIELGNGITPTDNATNYFVHNVLNDCSLKLRRGGANWKVLNNIFLGNDSQYGGYNATMLSFYYPSAPDVMFQSDYNIFCSPRSDMFYSQWTAEFLTLDQWRQLKGKGLDAHSQVYCPTIKLGGLVLSKSVFKDAGNTMTLNVRLFDKAGHRITDGRPDIGAYEALSVPIPGTSPIDLEEEQ